MVKLLEKATNDVGLTKSYLLLQDGTLFEGVSFGAQTPSDGEIGKWFFCLLLKKSLRISTKVFYKKLTFLKMQNFESLNSKLRYTL